MSILATKPPALVHANGRKLNGGVSRLAILPGSVASKMRADAKARVEKESGDAQKRAKLMLAAKANLHVTDKCPRGQFTLLDPATMPDADRTEAEAAGVTTRTLVLHPDDLDRAIAEFSRPDGKAN